MIRHAMLLLAMLALPSLAHAQEAAPSPAERQFAQIVALEGRWQVAETDALQIVFEKTARGHTMIERWETASGLHSITVYHLDGDRLIATHYCPQGNQPRLESIDGDDGAIAFRFRDITDLDDGESHTHRLRFDPQGDGSVVRTEVYTGPEGLGDPGIYTLVRVADPSSEGAGAGGVTAQADAEADAMYRRFANAYRDLDSAAIRAIYTEDCSYVQGSPQVGVSSCDSAMAGFAGMFESADEAGRQLSIAFKIERRRTYPDAVVDVGYYRLQSSDSDTPAYGKFVVVMERDQAGVWRFVVDGFSPAPAETYESLEVEPIVAD